MPSLTVGSQSQPLTVGFVGAGMMGGAMAKSLVQTGSCQPENVTFFDIDETRAESLAPLGVKPCESSVQVGARSAIIVIAVEPKDVPTVCEELACHGLGEGKIVVSLAAGVTMASLASWLHSDGLPIVRVMPNTPCVVGAMASGYACNEACSEADAALVGAMLGAMGSALRVGEEADLDAVTGVSGSGPAYVFQFIEAMSDGGVRMGLSRAVATRLAAQTVLGAGKMVLETQMHPGALKDMVTSPGGTTIAAVHALEQGGLRAAVINAVCAATEKSRELGRAGASGGDEAEANGGGKKKRKR